MHLEQRGNRIDVHSLDHGGFGALAAGRMRLGMSFSRARMATGNMPGTARTLPSSPKFADEQETTQTLSTRSAP